MHENNNKNYYKYKKDIGILLSCSENNEVTYQPIKVELPQCLNILDEINGNNKHSIKFNNEHTEEIFDLYGDPNLLSLRDVEINFNPSTIFSFLFLMQIKVNGEANFKNISYNVDYKNVTHIKFIRRYNLITKTPIILQYRLKQHTIINNNYSSRLLSDICELTFENNNKITESTEKIGSDESSKSDENKESDIIEEKCDIEYCTICRNSLFCQICDNVKKG